MSKVDILLLPPECEVCGHQVDHRFLKPWNGKEVCNYCIQHIEEESDHDVSTDYY